MTKDTTLSILIDADLKKAVNRLAKARGMKIRAIVELALKEQLEDMLDIAIYEERQHEKTVGAKEVASYLSKLQQNKI